MGYKFHACPIQSSVEVRAWMDKSNIWWWRHNERDSVLNYQPHDCFPNRLFRRRSKKTSKLCVTGLCAGNSPVIGEFPAQRASNAENVTIWRRHHDPSLNLRCTPLVTGLSCPPVHQGNDYSINLPKKGKVTASRATMLIDKHFSEQIFLFRFRK